MAYSNVNWGSHELVTLSMPARKRLTLECEPQSETRCARRVCITERATSPLEKDETVAVRCDGDGGRVQHEMWGPQDQAPATRTCLAPGLKDVSDRARS